MSKRPKIASPVGRSVAEWIGKLPDEKVPDRVRARIFDRAKGICHLSGRKIEAGEPWELEHVVALADGGEHREANLRPALASKHKVKTAAENKARAVLRRTRNAHTGALTKSPTPIRSPGFRHVEREQRGSKLPLPSVGLSQIARRYGVGR